MLHILYSCSIVLEWLTPFVRPRKRQRNWLAPIDRHMQDLEARKVERNANTNPASRANLGPVFQVVGDFNSRKSSRGPSHVQMQIFHTISGRTNGFLK
jgi:hypothetical protein